MIDDALRELVEFSRRIGRPENDYVVLAEGNTSVLLDDGTFLIKASGARLHGIEPHDFVRLELAPLLDAVLSSDHHDSKELFARARRGSTPGAGQPSIETFVHVAALGLGGARYVAHTHPTAIASLLCSTASEEIFLAGPLFPDEAVVCGPAPVYVPYFEPGIELGRALAPRIREHIERWGEAPRMALLGNHGMVALGNTASDVEAVTAMAVKAARVRATALAAGELRPLTAENVRTLLGRQDEIERRDRLFGKR